MKKTIKSKCMGPGAELTHKEARAVINQLKTNPEVCESCKIRSCKLAKYLWGV